MLKGSLERRHFPLFPAIRQESDPDEAKPQAEPEGDEQSGQRQIGEERGAILHDEWPPAHWV